MLYQQEFPELREWHSWPYSLESRSHLFLQQITVLPASVLPWGNSMSVQEIPDLGIQLFLTCKPVDQLKATFHHEFLKDYSLTSQRKGRSTTHRPRTWTHDEHAPLSSRVCLEEPSPLIPWGAWELSISCPAPCPVLCHKYLLFSTSQMSVIDFLYV